MTGELTRWWFAKENAHVHFSAGPQDDDYIAQRFSPEWFLDHVTALDPLECLLWFDQIARHIARATNTVYPNRYLVHALELVDQLLPMVELYPAQQRVFVLLPLRHSRQLQSIYKARNLVMQWMLHIDPNMFNPMSSDTMDDVADGADGVDLMSDTEHKSKVHNQAGDLLVYKRFYMATLRDIHTYTYLRVQPLKWTSPMETNVPQQFIPLLDRRCSTELDRKCHTIGYILPVSSNSPGLNSTLPPVHAQQLAALKARFPQEFTLSISGGVDSNLCAALARYFGCNFNALYINYSNRPDSQLEEEFIAWYCARLNIDVFVCRIPEIRRTSAMRQFYEEYTRTVRFDAYRSMDRPIVLGHNDDDRNENFIRNVSKRQFNDLAGMHYRSIINGVEIFRPLLNTKKIVDFTPLDVKHPYFNSNYFERNLTVYELAAMFGVVHLGNSTPAWSQRGMIRAKVLPHVPQEFKDSIDALSQHVQQLNDLVRKLIEDIPVLRTEKSIIFTMPSLDRTAWEIMFRRLGVKISHKCLYHMVEQFERNELVTVRLNGEQFIQRRSDGTHCIYVRDS